MEFADFGKFLLGGGLIAHGLIDSPEAKVGVGLFGIQFHSAFERCDCLLIVALLSKNRTEVEMRDANVIPRLYGLLEQGYSRVRIVFLHRDIAEIRQGLRIIRVNRQFGFEFRFGLVVLLQFPIQVAKAKMHVGFLRSGFYGLLELGGWLPESVPGRRGPLP